MQIGAVLRRAADALRAAGVESPALEARLLLAHALDVPQTALLDRAAEIDPNRFDALLARRLAREPMALILGHQGFWTLDLEVSPATLIPRPDSETLIEAALEAFPDRTAVRRVLDLGTGTGCLLLAALSEFPAAWGVGIDRAPAAAALAARNARRNGLASRAAVVCADWASPIRGRFDLILSNPPYIASQEIGALMPEVAVHEPASALDGGLDGLDAYRTLIPALPGLLNEAGTAVLELGQGQAESARNLARQAGFAAPALRRDLAGIARALVLHRAVP
ncbi:peptide chain release factor N(5)-glutamine methyltransferase [Limobrevibacterium gyesilva]|uniref:Release factor glutamine methyltransferase n=1 Tax=Limobrevibacterium gyesilva TaxID=2991712 RepID=A0AA41YM24_9PROT|nr:peptide chain release factor N(5)-glutamine methyltransferase [Limobrevibacterium gyesilva]MCW3472958.1 peptide chain release factor N(5)-glutamine methyltransferase [Limobrevibacterium gyesilva]